MDLSKVNHNPCLEELTNLICRKTQNTDTNFFHVEVAYFLCKIAASMRAYIDSADRGQIPVNCYAICLAQSGYSKGYSVNIMEYDILSGFRKQFMIKTFNEVAEQNILDRAAAIAVANGDPDPSEVEEKLRSSYEKAGNYVFTFDSGTGPAVKQMRNKLLLAGIGAINVQIDECFEDNVEVLTSTGFRLFKEVTENDLIAEFDVKEKNLSFSKPLRLISKPYQGTLYKFTSPTSFDFSVTEHHEVLVQNTADNLVKKFPADVKTGDKFLVALTNEVQGEIEELDFKTRLALAIQADGSFGSKYHVKFGFNKQRKIQRLQWLCNELGFTLRYSESKVRPGFFHLSLCKSEIKGIIFSKDLRDILPPVGKISTNFAREVLNELVQWDGSQNKKYPTEFRFTNKFYHNVDLVQQYAFIAGYRSHIVSNNKEGYEGGYYVRWNTNSLSTHSLGYLNKKDEAHNPIRTTSEYDGTVYCATMPKGTLVVRRNGKICIQGNCGSNLLNSPEVIATFLELFDQGRIKSKLIKNTTENVRDLDLDGKTPANMLLFGTPVKLFDGGTTEDYFYSMLDTGYARRCLFGLGGEVDKKAYYSKTAEEIYEALTEPRNKEITDKWNEYFISLAQKEMVDFRIELQRPEAIKLLEYRIECEKLADSLSPYEELQKAELNHRYFKALKLAGAYAFIDKSPLITETYLLQAIKLVEESGENFLKILHREKPYMKLAKYLSNASEELTHADLTEALPFYRSPQKSELMALATAWGYKHNIIIKRSFSDGVEFFKGDTLEETNLDSLVVSYSTDFARDYKADYAPFDQLGSHLFQLEGMNWCNHHFNNEHRCTEDALPTFNMVVLDVDGEVSLNVAESLLTEYCYIMYTTKRSTEEINRFRIILPLKFTLNFSAEDYKAFMNNVLKWLPFKSDEAANQIAKKWSSHAGGELRVHKTDVLLDPTKFIPNTLRNESFLSKQKKITSLDNLERWFANQMEVGNRNNLFLKYALCLVDSGLEFDSIEAKVLSFNKKLKDKLPEEELQKTVLITAYNKYCEKRES